MFSVIFGRKNGKVMKQCSEKKQEKVNLKSSVHPFIADIYKNRGAEHNLVKINERSAKDIS